MRGSHGSAEGTHNHIVVCFVPCILDCHILEQMTVCSEDVVGPGAHLPAPAEHATHPSVPQPQLAPWEEMRTHVLQAHPVKGRHDCSIPCVSL